MFYSAIGSIIALLASMIAYPATAEEWFRHPLAGELSRLPITTMDFMPPLWLQPCQIITADASEQIHLPTCAAGASQKSDRWPFMVAADEGVLRRMEEVNNLMNALTLSGDPEDMIATAKEKRRFLLRSGFPSLSLRLAYVTIDIIGTDGTVIEVDHVVLVARLEGGDVVLDSKLKGGVEILPWEFSPYRFYGIEAPTELGKWLVVADDRDDPIERAYEWLCAVQNCIDVAPPE